MKALLLRGIVNFCAGRLPDPSLRDPPQPSRLSTRADILQKGVHKAVRTAHGHGGSRRSECVRCILGRHVIEVLQQR